GTHSIGVAYGNKNEGRPPAVVRRLVRLTSSFIEPATLVAGSATELAVVLAQNRVKRVPIATILFACSLCMGQASAVSKQDLESRFQKKVFFIRGFYVEDHLVYDAQGNVEGNPATGPWSIAAVRVERVR